MKYELAKQLKAAGFPQFVGNFNGKIIEDPNSPNGEESLSCYNPTLSELIEACGEKFEAIIRRPLIDKWEAYAFEKYRVYGSTPEEAVAKLWMALNPIKVDE